MKYLSLAAFFTLVMFAGAALFGLGCGEDLSGSGNSGDDDSGDDDSGDDDSGDDDDDNDDTADDDDDSDDDDDDDDDFDPLMGPVDIDGDADLEYLYVRTTAAGSWPDVTYTYQLEVRNTTTKKAEWSYTYQVTGGSMTFALYDLDADDTWEIVETTNQTVGGFLGRVTVRDGNDGFAVVFDSGDRTGVNLYADGDWDIDADGEPELHIKANPAFDAGVGGYLQWYEGPGGYDKIKEVQAGIDHYIDAYAGWDQSRHVPVPIAGGKDAQYVTVERWFEDSQWGYELAVRRQDNDAALWTKTHPPFMGYMFFGLADVDADGTWEVIEAKNFYDITYQEYSGKALVYDGDDGFAVAFNTQTVQDVHLYAYGNYDIDADGDPEVLVQAYPEPGAGGFLRFYEAAAGYDRIKDITFATGVSGHAVLRGVGGLLTPVDIDGDGGLEFGVASWRVLDASTTAYTLRIFDKNGGDPVWERTYNLTGGNAAFALGDLDLDGTYEIIEQFNYAQADKGALDCSAQVTVRDGNENFGVVYDSQLLGDRQLYAQADWDIDRDGRPELFVRSTALADSGEEFWCRWFEGPADYEQVKVVSAPASSSDLRCYGGYLRPE